MSTLSIYIYILLSFFCSLAWFLGFSSMYKVCFYCVGVKKKKKNIVRFPWNSILEPGNAFWFGRCFSLLWPSLSSLTVLVTSFKAFGWRALRGAIDFSYMAEIQYTTATIVSTVGGLRVLLWESSCSESSLVAGTVINMKISTSGWRWPAKPSSLEAETRESIAAYFKSAWSVITSSRPPGRSA